MTKKTHEERLEVLIQFFTARIAQDLAALAQAASLLTLVRTRVRRKQT